MNHSMKAARKAARVLNGLTQEDLAEAIGKQQAWVSLVENGRMLPTKSEAAEIAKVLQVETHELFKRYCDQ